MGKYEIAVLAGDGIGPEVIQQGVKCLKKIESKFGHKFDFTEALIGGVAVDATGIPLPDETIQLAQKSDAVYLGAVGDWKYDKLDPSIRPEKALLGIRKALNLYANLRPAIVSKDLLELSPLKEERVRGVDMMIVRELISGIYFGEPRGVESRNGERVGFNNMIYTESEIRQIAKVGFETAMKRGKKLCSVDKANVLDVSRLWREVVIEVSKDYPEVELSHMYVDNASMQIVRDPRQFDVIVTSNIFGDILSDTASMLPGSLGMLPSASLSDDGPGMYEPVHGSAPDLKGKDVVNPIATILSAAMMLKYSFKLNAEAEAIENAVNEVLKENYRTQDIMTEGKTLVGTIEMGNLIADKI